MLYEVQALKAAIQKTDIPARDDEQSRFDAEQIVYFLHKEGYSIQIELKKEDPEED